MKNFDLDPINAQIQEFLEEMQIYLQKFDELKDCYIEDYYIKLNTYHLLSVRSDRGKVIVDNCWETVWDDIDLNREEVFNNIGEKLTSIQIKEPSLHKKIIEDLKIGDCYYRFNLSLFTIDENTINNINCWQKIYVAEEDNLNELNYLIKYSRIIIALNKKEIESKVLD